MRKRIQWSKCTDNNWAYLEFLDLKNPILVKNGKYNTGVYVIWSKSENRVIRIGSGRIAKRLDEHIRNPEIRKHLNLLVTFAVIEDEEVMRGVESYLADLYSPVVGDRFPDVNYIYVNHPDINVDVDTEILSMSIL